MLPTTADCCLEHHLDIPYPMVNLSRIPELDLKSPRLLLVPHCPSRCARRFNHTSRSSSHRPRICAVSQARSSASSLWSVLDALVVAPELKAPLGPHRRQHPCHLPVPTSPTPLHHLLHSARQLVRALAPLPLDQGAQRARHLSPRGRLQQLSYPCLAKTCNSKFLFTLLWYEAISWVDW